MRSKLFAPGDRPDLISEYLRSKCDALAIDFEDTVHPERKAAARDNVAAFLAGRNRTSDGKRLLIRVNGPTSPLFEADLAVAVHTNADMVNVPKLESAEEAVLVCEAIERLEAKNCPTHRLGILANIETPRGLRRAAEIASAHPRVSGLQIGYADLFEPYGIDRSDEAALSAVRFQVRMAAAEADIPTYDGVFAGIGSPDLFRLEAENARRMGLAGKSCFTPEQAEISNAVFQPTPEEIAKAIRIVEASRAARQSSTGLFEVDGRLVDAPFLRGAERILEDARRVGLLP